METATIFICEDDGILRRNLAKGLAEEGYRTLAADCGTAFLKLLDDDPKAQPGACVIDIGLPDCDGRDLCQALRSRGVGAPVLFLTAKSALADRLAGFAAGGDDYLGKPFAYAELLARLGALLRREAPGTKKQLPLELDPTTHAVRLEGRTAYLTPTEFRLLACLAGASEGAASRQAMLRAAWPAGAQVAQNTLDSYVARLRHKLGALEGAPHIVTLRATGYRLNWA